MSILTRRQHLKRICALVACGLLLAAGSAGCASRAISATDPSFDKDKRRATRKVAIVVQDRSNNKNIPAEWLRLVEDQFLVGAIRKRYSTASRSDVETLVREMKLQQEGITEESAKQFRKLVGASAVMVVDITEFEYEFTVEQRTRGRQIGWYRHVDPPVPEYEYITHTVNDPHKRDPNGRCAVSARLVDTGNGLILWQAVNRKGNSFFNRLKASDLLIETSEKVADCIPKR